MNDVHVATIAAELGLDELQVKATVTLLDDDATVPFIARYRKEATGSLDEVAITAIRDRIAQLRELDKRREAILKSLEERQLLTDELKEKSKPPQRWRNLKIFICRSGPNGGPARQSRLSAVLNLWPK